MNKYKFPIWFRIYPDENIVSWLEALFSVNGMPKEAFSVAFEGSAELLELEDICRRYEGDKFPTLEEIMSRHSEFSTMMPFRNESMNVLVAEQVIRKAEDFHIIPGNKKNHCKALMCCPECLAEDMANGRRPYIRAWHSLHGVTACAKHGCRLQIYSIYDSDKPIVPADEESLRYAKFLYQVYLHQPKVTLDDIKDLLAGTKTGRLILDRLTINSIIKAFYEKYEPDGFIEQIKGREKEGCQIVSNTCPHCGTIYHSFGLARSYGYECPICERKYDGLELLQKRIDLSWNGEYEVTGYEDEAHVRIRHRPCGREYMLSLNARGLTKRQLCDKCDYKYRDRIGRKATMNSGETCRIIAYRSSTDLDVEFEDGAVARHTTYTNFKLGMIGHPDDTPKEQAKRRLGEKRTMNCGLHAEIIRYGAYADIDVRFENGYIARHAAYKEFVKGSIRPPFDRVGETNIMNNGLKATIIAYRKHIDMDVRFEDGSVAEHIDYRNFMEGRVARPQDSRRNKRKLRIGEKKTMKCGLEAEIIAYRRCEDMDVRFEDGSVAEHIEYRNFVEGRVARPQNSRRNKRKLRIGEKKMMKCGLEAEIVAYRRSEDMDVRFPDGAVVKNVGYGNFKRGMVGHPKD